jgi:hypothetical protein
VAAPPYKCRQLTSTVLVTFTVLRSLCMGLNSDTPLSIVANAGAAVSRRALRMKGTSCLAEIIEPRYLLIESPRDSDVEFQSDRTVGVPRSKSYKEHVRATRVVRSTDMNFTDSYSS